MTRRMEKRSVKPRKRPAGYELGLWLAIMLVCAVLLLVLEWPQPDAAQDASGMPLFAAASPEVQSVRIMPEGGDAFTLVLSSGGGYAVEEDAGMVLRADRTSSLFAEAESLRLTPMARSDDWAPYGLSPAACEIRISTADEEKSLLLGSLTPSGTARYVRMDGELYTARLFLSGIPTLSTLHALPSLYGNGEMPSEFLLCRRDGSRVAGGITDGRTLGVTTLVVTEPFQWEMDIEQAAELINGIGGITFLSWQMKKSPENLAQCGLDKPLSFTARYQPEDGEPLGWTLYIGDAMDDQSVYVCLEDDENIFAASLASVRFLEEMDAANLISRFAGLVMLDLIDTVQIGWDGGSAILSRAQADGAVACTVNGAACTEEDFRALYQQLIAPRVDGLLPDSAQYGQPRLSLRYQLKDGSEEKVDYCAWSPEFDAVERNGEALFYISRDKVDAVLSSMKQLEP